MRRLILAAALPVAAVVGVAVVGGASACGPACRQIEIQPLALQCDERARFSGEIHLDSAGAFDTFVGQQCMPEAADEDVAAIVEGVDFSTSAVFVASGPNDAAEQRCIADRIVERALVCEDGLKVYFRDRYGNDDPCVGSWTAAFALARADLRVILAAD